MKYFLPDWDDRVDPGFDFKTERFTLQRTPRDDIYAHELFEEKVYDGILVSRMALGEKGKKREEAEKIGLRNYLRLPAEYELMGDCGAFGYINEERPPFDTNHIIDYYEKMRFDLAVSVDHIVIPAFEDQNETRYKITIENALDFLSESKRRQVDFIPIGAVQGWNIPTYVEAAKTLADAGYDYLAIGGLARSPNKVVVQICTEVARAVPGVKIHVFGVARANLASVFASIGITSADSASPLRQAWLAAKDNYYTQDRAYAAIRIPVVKEQRPVVGSLVHSSEASLDDLASAEKSAISAVRSYAAKSLNLTKTLAEIKKYDVLLGKRKFDDKDDDRDRMYRDTLKERLWEKCPCPICDELGVEVVIFRGSNRNRRRGFHNLWTLRQKLEAMPSAPHEEPFDVQIPLLQ